MNFPRWEQLTSKIELPSSTAERLAAALNASPSAAVAVVGGEPEAFGTSIASRMSSRGVVYSIALSDDVAPAVAPRPVLGHVKLRHRDNDRLPFADASIDLVLWAFTLRSVGHVARMLSETKRVLRPGGRFAVADWVRQDEAFGPLRDDRVSAATCQRCLTAGGFGVLGQLMLNASHYLVVGRRPFADMAPLGIGMLNAM
ncbi:MAG TPA: methyltransferase domain-containing protein [Gemmatimonadaceae bacterium]